MYAIYREVHPPTGIEHCLECHFVDETQKNLVTAATSVLRVFRLVSYKPACLYCTWRGGYFAFVIIGQRCYTARSIKGFEPRWGLLNSINLGSNLFWHMQVVWCKLVSTISMAMWSQWRKWDWVTIPETLSYLLLKTQRWLEYCDTLSLIRLCAIHYHRGYMFVCCPPPPVVVAGWVWPGGQRSQGGFITPVWGRWYQSESCDIVGVKMSCIAGNFCRRKFSHAEGRL